MEDRSSARLSSFSISLTSTVFSNNSATRLPTRPPPIIITRWRLCCSTPVSSINRGRSLLPNRINTWSWGRISYSPPGMIVVIPRAIATTRKGKSWYNWEIFFSFLWARGDVSLMRIAMTCICSWAISIISFPAVRLITLTISWAANSSGWINKSIFKSSVSRIESSFPNSRERTRAILRWIPKRSAIIEDNIFTASLSVTAMRKSISSALASCQHSILMALPLISRASIFPSA